jgi:predicted transcriptional regulator
VAITQAAVDKFVKKSGGGEMTEAEKAQKEMVEENERTVTKESK